MLPCLLSCPLSDPPLSCLSCMHLAIVGLAALLFFSPVCQHLIFFSLCAPLSFTSHGRPYHFSLFSVIFLVACTMHSCCPSNVFISDLIPPCHSAHPSQHPHLIYSSRASCPLVVAHVSAPYNRAGLTTVL